MALRAGGAHEPVLRVRSATASQTRPTSTVSDGDQRERPPRRLPPAAREAGSGRTTLSAAASGSALGAVLLHGRLSSRL